MLDDTDEASVPTADAPRSSEKSPAADAPRPPHQKARQQAQPHQSTQGRSASSCKTWSPLPPP